MSHHDPDIVAVRELSRGAEAPTDESAVGRQIVEDDVTVARPLPPYVADGVVYQATWTQKIVNDLQ